MINIKEAQNHFRNSWCPLCIKSIREILFLRKPAANNEVVKVHHILDKQMKMVFGKWRMSQPDPRSSFTTCKIQEDLMQEAGHTDYLEYFKRLMDTVECPKCGRIIDAIELKLMFTEDGSIKFLHSNHPTHIFETGREYSYNSCALNDKEFYDVCLSFKEKELK